MRSYLGNLGAVILIAVSVMSLFAGAGTHRQGGVNAACVSNIGKVATGITEYVQDWDETFPVATTGSQLESAILPYTQDASVFICPATGVLYQPKATLSGQSLTAITGDYGTIWIVMDAKKHPDGLLTAAFLDGHITHGGVDQADPNTECVSNVAELTHGVLEYAQDHNEVLPPMQSSWQFENAVYPYIHSHYRFRCPATGVPYKTNAKLSGQSLSTIRDYYTTWVVKDAKKHPDGLFTIAYLDGHVTRGGVDQTDPNTECLNNVRNLTVGLSLYVQDYDEYLPPMKSSWQFENAIAPYVKSRHYFRCPATGLHYVPNPALSGTSLNSYTSPSTVEVLRDAKPHADGLSTYSYLDGHVVRK